MWPGDLGSVLSMPGISMAGRDDLARERHGLRAEGLPFPGPGEELESAQRPKRKPALEQEEAGESG